MKDVGTQHLIQYRDSPASLIKRSTQSVPKQSGFTLLEVMLVIVIMAVMTSLVVMNVQGVSHRKTLQAKEFLSLDLQKIAREAHDQGRILGLVVLPATDIAPAAYQVVEYVAQTQPQNMQQNINAGQPSLSYTWQVAVDFKPVPLPDQVNLTIQSLNQQATLDTLQRRTMQQNQSNRNLLPQLVWLGNGDVLPARLQLFQTQQPIGAAIELNSQGRIIEQGDAS